MESKHSTEDLKHTCDVVDGIEADSKASNFERIVLLVAPHEVHQIVPIIFCELGIIVGIQRRALEVTEAWGWLGPILRVVQGGFPILARIKKKTDLPCAGIVRILNDFLVENWASNIRIFINSRGMPRWKTKPKSFERNASNIFPKHGSSWNSNKPLMSLLRSG